MAKPGTGKQIGVRIFPEQERWLEEESARRQVSVAVLVREALTKMMREKKGK
jgi:predicted HicB family RNase H-like nuclease